MKTAGIIAEFNPFHHGHRYLIEQVRQAGATHIAVVMSGSFVQRGEPALFSKWERTEAALRCGVDLVLELPAPYALGSAERFATGGVGLLQALGCLDFLSFGSECGDISLIERAAACCLEVEQKQSNTMAVYLKQGLSYPAARQQAVAELDEAAAALLARPNDTLGVEYAKAALRLGAPFARMTVKRAGSSHDADTPSGQFASASYLRKELAAGRAVADYLPAGTAGCYSCGADATRLEQVILWRLRGMSVAEFAMLPDVTEGLEHRLYAAAQSAQSVCGFLEAVKTKRYPHARLRRIVWYAMLGLRAEDYSLPLPYLRVLGFGAGGREILRVAKKTAQLPIVSDFPQVVAASERFAMLEKAATDLRGLAVTPIEPCGQDYTRKLIVSED